MTALAYEPFVFPPGHLRLIDAPAVESRLERVPADATLPRHLAEYKTLAAHDWDVTVLLAPDSKTVVLLACREAIV